jgi:hypothetical protein
VSTHTGDISEISFMLRAKKAGFSVLTPYSSLKYDFVIEKNGKFYKVQCKSTATPQYYKDNSTYYKIICSHGASGKKLYEKKDVDYFAFYIVNLDIFYIVPFCKIKTKTIKIKPFSINCKYKNYIENFNFIN